MKELIAAIEALMFTPPYHGPRSEGFNGGASAAIDLINKALEGKVIVDEWKVLQIENNATYSAFNLLEPDNSQHFNEMVSSVSHIVDTTSPRDSLLMVVRDLNAMLDKS